MAEPVSSHSKKCLSCGETKALSEFYSYRRGGESRPFGTCKACVLQKQRARLLDPVMAEKRKATTKKYSLAHLEQIREKSKRYQPIANQRAKERRASDPSFRIGGTLRRRITSALNGRQKSAATVELLGCSVEDFRSWLQFQFSGAMAWENYGSLWEIDHVRPCCSFDLEDAAQQRECFSWKNQRPLLISLNRIKNDAVDILVEKEHLLVVNKWTNRI